jgi:antitoxin Phd
LRVGGTFFPRVSHLTAAAFGCLGALSLRVESMRLDARGYQTGKTPGFRDLTGLTRLKPVNWQIQEAKARFSEMVDRALKEGPQTVIRHGKPVAVLVPADAYRRLRTRGKSLKALLAAAPLGGVEITRSRDTGRAARKEPCRSGGSYFTTAR